VGVLSPVLARRERDPKAGPVLSEAVLEMEGGGRRGGGKGKRGTGKGDGQGRGGGKGRREEGWR